MNKLVSVIIPTYSRPTYLVRAINSVQRQTYYPIEIIVVDDNGKGSDCQIETEHILCDYIRNNSIRYICHDVNKNGSAARNTGFRLSRGAFVTFFDDDDEMLPRKIEKQVEILNKHPEAYASYVACEIYKKKRLYKHIPAKMCGNLKLDLLSHRWTFGSGSNILFVRKAIENLGGFDETFLRFQDVEIVVRFFRKYEIINIDEVLLKKHDDEISQMPNIEKYYTVLQHFFETFDSDIKEAPAEISREIYKNRYMDLCARAATASNYKVFFETLKLANRYKKLSIFDYARVIRHLIFKPMKR